MLIKPLIVSHHRQLALLTIEWRLTRTRALTHSLLAAV